MLRAGVDAHRVQRILRHSDIRTTLGTYSHIDVEDLRAAVNSIAPQPEGPKVGHRVMRIEKGLVSTEENLNDDQAFSSGHSRFRTCDPRRVKLSKEALQTHAHRCI